MPRSKITIVGAGHVGASTAQWVAAKELGDIVLIDVIPGLAQGKALDLQQAGPLASFDCHILGTDSYVESAGSDVIVITAGVARKPGMTRNDLLRTNYTIVQSVIEQIVPYSPQACIIMVTNPVDPLTHLAWKTSGLPPHRVMGMAGVLDSARMRAFLAMELNVSMEDVSAFVLGGHGDHMVPLIRYACIGGIPVEQLISQERLEAIIERTRSGGSEIVSLLQSGSAYLAPGAAIAQMVEAIVRDKKRILPTVAYLNGEYGEQQIFVGVPAVIGARGVERVLELELNDEEYAAFSRSIESVRELTYVFN